MYVVNCGYKRNGRENNRLFDSLEDAQQFCFAVFENTMQVLTITKR